MSKRSLVLRADDVQPFSIPGQEAKYSSQLVIGPDGVGSADLLLHRFVLRPHQRTSGHSHPDNDEAYYVLSGKAWLTVGEPRDGESDGTYLFEPGMVAFLPAGTPHLLENGFDEDLVILTIWPRAPRPGANPIHETRIKAWGTSFKFRDGKTWPEPATDSAKR